MMNDFIVLTHALTSMEMSVNVSHITSMFRVDQVGEHGVSSMTHILLVNGQMIPARESISRIVELIREENIK